MNKALFLDRDGVINIDNCYVSTKKDFQFQEGIFDFVNYFSKKSYLIIVITNQSGIGRGLYSNKDFLLLSKWMINEFKERNIFITDIKYCPYHPSKGKGKYLRDSIFRKPNPGMVLKSKSKYNLNLKKSFIIGDRWRDVGVAQKTKCISILIDRNYDEKMIFKPKYIVKKIGDIYKIIK